MKTEYKTPEKNIQRAIESDSGEVFTPPELVEKLLSHVDITLDAKILEPTCGNGQILSAIVEKKIDAANEKIFTKKGNLRKSLSDKDRREICYTVFNTIYACDIMKDNVADTRKRVIDMIPTGWISDFGITKKHVNKILRKRIVWGDSAKVLMQADYEFTINQSLGDNAVMMQDMIELDRADRLGMKF